MKLKTIIIDDEQHCIDTLIYDLNTCCGEWVEIVNTFHNPLEAMKRLKKEPIDLLFIDIEMPSVSGFDLLEIIEPEHCNVIFTTAHSKHAIKAIGFKAEAFLLKPIQADELEEIVFHLYEKHQLQKPKLEKLVVPIQEGFEVIDFEHIIFCQAESNYTTIFLDNSQAIVASKTLKSIGEKLPSKTFIRVHKSFIINLNQLQKFIKTDGGNIILKNGKEIPVSKSYRDELVRILQKMK